MASEPIRDPNKDHLLTPKNCTFLIIDYQPVQVNSIASMERQHLVSNIVRASKAAVLYGLPIVHSTVNVKSGVNKPPIKAVRTVLEHVSTYDRTSINAWEDVEFRKAVEATGRKKLVMTALWTEACLAFQDRKSTRLNSSHSQISYAVFCLKKKINKDSAQRLRPDHQHISVPPALDVIRRRLQRINKPATVGRNIKRRRRIQSQRRRRTPSR